MTVQLSSEQAKTAVAYEFFPRNGPQDGRVNVLDLVRGTRNFEISIVGPPEAGHNGSLISRHAYLALRSPNGEPEIHFNERILPGAEVVAALIAYKGELTGPHMTEIAKLDGGYRLKARPREMQFALTEASGWSELGLY
jgi:hypothetical protein